VNKFTPTVEADELVGLYCGNDPRNACTTCHIANAAISVVLAVWFWFKELKVPFMKVYDGCVLGSG
jgi:hypothetical protein